MCPHEIGIFLGYPLIDVAIFANCPDKKCLSVGYWKVYSNIDEAKKIFNRYDMARKYTTDLILNGAHPRDILHNNLLFNT